jgi:3-dehydroquinate dehydratase-2
VQVVVLNGVNLDVLGRRDPATYGQFTLQELETRIYEWASKLGCHVRCRQTNSEGEYVEWCHDALELFEAPIVEVHLSNVDEREEWRRNSVISDLAARRIIGKGPDGYREALEFLVESVPT